MKQMLANAAFLFALFVGALSLLGCDQTPAPSAHTEVPEHNAVAIDDKPTNTIRSSGNMLYVVRDVADLHLKADQHVEQLKQTQTALKTAINGNNLDQAQQLAEQLKQQLNAFNSSLDSLNLKSQEIEGIRQNIQTANQQLLASPFLNGQVDLSQMNLKQVQQQMGNIQNEMLKLAAMLLNDQALTTADNNDES